VIFGNSKIPRTREVQAAIFSYPYDFDIWDKLMEQDVYHLFLEGVTIERKHFKDIHELLAVVRQEQKIAGWNVPVANLPYIFFLRCRSHNGKGEPFAACYMDTPEGRVYSLRKFR